MRVWDTPCREAAAILEGEASLAGLFFRETLVSCAHGGAAPTAWTSRVNTP